MQGQESDNNLFCLYRDCEDLAIFGDYCKVHQFHRAEAAEARAADLQARLGAMHSEHEYVTAEWKRTIDRAAQLETERDSERKERESLYPVLDEKSRVNKSLRDDVVKLEAERDELLGKLEQAQRDNERLMEVVRGLSKRLSEATAWQR